MEFLILRIPRRSLRSSNKCEFIVKHEVAYSNTFRNINWRYLRKWRTRTLRFSLEILNVTLNDRNAYACCTASVIREPLCCRSNKLSCQPQWDPRVSKRGVPVRDLNNEKDAKRPLNLTLTELCGKLRRSLWKFSRELFFSLNISLNKW